VSGQRGTTLLEVVLATLLLGVAAAGLLGTVHRALAGVQAAREHSRAVTHANSVLDELLALPRLRAGQALQGSADATSGWQAVAEPLQLQNDRPGPAGLVEIQVEVWWLSGGQRKTLALEGYRREEAR